MEEKARKNEQRVKYVGTFAQKDLFPFEAEERAVTVFIRKRKCRVTRLLRLKRILTLDLDSVKYST